MRKKLIINPKHLLMVYAALPSALILIAIDKLLLNDSLRYSFPSDPNEYAIFAVLFTLPHIIASFFALVDQEYFSTYKSRLLRGAQLSVLVAILLPVVSPQIAFALIAILTMTHVLFQQTGISRSLMKGTNKFHRWWEWTGAILSSVLYLSIFTDFDLTKNSWALVAAGVGVIVFCVLGVVATLASESREGRLYFWMTHLLVVLSGLFLLLDYPLLTIAVPRIIHDLTAYIYYVCHDTNRFQQKPSNLIYRFTTSKLKLPIYLVSPVLSILIATTLRSEVVIQHVLPLVSAGIVLHYHTESYIWKRESLHRRYISYSN